MHEAKNTQRALVKIGYDGRVHKTFRGPKAQERFENEVRVLQYLEDRKCPFVPRLLEHDPDQLMITTSNCGSIVEHIGEDRAKEIFDELLKYGVRHEDAYARNITYRPSDGRFCAIDFEFATILDEDWDPSQPPGESIDTQPSIQKVAWSGWSSRGTVRPNNEDAFLALRLDEKGLQYLGVTGEASCTSAEYIFAVSDGMGGENSGEFASRIALEKITYRLPKEYGISESEQDSYSLEVLAELFKSIHSAMLDLGRHDPNCEDMGATLTLVWMRRRHAYFAHIGDSRLYRLRPEESMEQLTEDHTHVGWLRRQGQVNEREARSHPRKNALDQALGANHRYLNPHLGQLDYTPGERFLLCTDGITEALWDHRIEDLLRDTNLESAASDLVMRSVSESGRDNATAVVVRVQ